MDAIFIDAMLSALPAPRRIVGFTNRANWLDLRREVSAAARRNGEMMLSADIPFENFLWRSVPICPDDQVPDAVMNLIASDTPYERALLSV